MKINNWVKIRWESRRYFGFIPSDAEVVALIEHIEYERKEGQHNPVLIALWRAIEPYYEP